MHLPERPRLTFGQRFWPLFIAGMLGIATLPIITIPLLRTLPPPTGAPDLPFALLVALSLVNPVLYLAATTALGAAVTPQLGLQSLLVQSRTQGNAAWGRLRAAAPLSLALGLAVAALTLGLDMLLQPYLSDAWRAGAEAIAQPSRAASLLAGMMYGGITEEIMLRWGVMSLIAWIGWRFVQRRRAAPSPAIMWSAIVLAAVLFGIAHLPAAAAIAPLETALVVRTVALNSLAGLFFGWLFWAHNLEAAMLAHMSAHIGLALIALSGVTA